MPNATESSVGRKFGTLVGGGFLSKALGVAREVALAYAFGTTYVADAFRVALTTLLLPTQFLTGEALFGAFIPAYRKLAPDERPSLVRAVFTSLIGLSVLIALVVVIAAPVFVAILAPGFDSRTAELCADLIRVGSLGAVLYAFSALLINVQIAHGDYRLHAARPSIQNVCTLAAIVTAATLDRPALLTLGFVAAYAALTAWAVREVRLSPLPLHDSLRPTRRWRHPATGEFGRAVGQLSVFVLLVQASMMVDRIVASLTGVGGVAAVDYGFFITDSLRLLLAVPVATLALGQLGGRDWEQVSPTLSRFFVPLVVGSVLLAAFLFGMADQIVTLLYRRGQFQETATALTTASLRGFSIGAWAVSAAYILQRVFNATLRNREVVRAGALSLGVNVALDIALYRPLGVFGVALATSISGIVLFAVLVLRARLVRVIASRAWITVPVLAAWAFTLPHIRYAGVAGLALAGVALTVYALAALALSRSLREDLLWMFGKLRTR